MTSGASQQTGVGHTGDSFYAHQVVYREGRMPFHIVLTDAVADTLCIFREPPAEGYTGKDPAPPSLGVYAKKFLAQPINTNVYCDPQLLLCLRYTDATPGFIDEEPLVCYLRGTSQLPSVELVTSSCAGDIKAASWCCAIDVVVPSGSYLSAREQQLANRLLYSTAWVADGTLPLQHRHEVHTGSLQVVDVYISWRTLGWLSMNQLALGGCLQPLR